MNNWGQKKYDIFICYRGYGVDNGISIKTAEWIYQQYERINAADQVFFAPRTQEKEGRIYNFVQDAKTIISKVKLMIVVLCSSFFSNFDDEEQSVTRIELIEALKQGVQILPIITDGFDWMRDDKKNKRLAEQALTGVDISSLVNTGAIMMTGVANGSEVWESIRQKASNAISVQDDEAAYVAYDLVKSDPYGCGNTIFVRGNIIKKGEYVTSLYHYRRGDAKYYIMQDFITEFEEYKEKCMLSDDDFVYWPVAVDGTESKNASFSICALCFGMIILHNHLKETKQENPRLVQALKGAMNLLIALRSPMRDAWPASWNDDNRGVLIEGTINQTTLSLSTLLTCGFLDGVGHDVFKERYRFILESIDALLGAKNGHENLLGGGLIYWGYMLENNSNPAILPTAFVFDTLLKFQQKIEKYAHNCVSFDAEFAKKLQEKVQEIQEILRGVMQYFADEQDTNGGFQSQGKNSIPHTAKVVKSMLLYVLAKESTEDETYHTAKNIAQKGLAWMESLYDDRAENKVHQIFRESTDMWEDFERFYYTADVVDDETLRPGELRSQGEDYEHSKELAYVDTLLKGLSIFPTKRQRYLQIAGEVLQKFRQGRVSIRGGTLMVKGRRAGLEYPIYALYYYRMATANYVDAITKGK